MARLEAGGVGATLMTLQKVAAALDHTATVELSGCELRSSRQIFSGFATKVKQVGAWRLSSGVRSSREACMQAGDSFEEFVVAVSPRLQRAFVARYGVDLGDEALADALSWAWEHRDQLNEMENPTGYLYRVGQTSVRSNVRRRRRALLPAEEPISPATEPEPGLHTALERLTDDQRVAVLLVHAHGYTYAEAATMLDIPITTLRNHIHRGMNRLRRHLEP